jgi:hypothetical protein
VLSQGCLAFALATSCQWHPKAENYKLRLYFASATTPLAIAQEAQKRDLNLQICEAAFAENDEC